MQLDATAQLPGMIQPRAQEPLQIRLTRGLDQQPKPVPAADLGEWRLHRPEHLDHLGAPDAAKARRPMP